MRPDYDGAGHMIRRPRASRPAPSGLVGITRDQRDVLDRIAEVVGTPNPTADEGAYRRATHADLPELTNPQLEQEVWRARVGLALADDPAWHQERLRAISTEVKLRQTAP